MKLLLLHTVTAFFVGGFFITAITFVAERFGSKLGGFIGGLPSTGFVALLFIGIVGGVDSSVASASVLPLAMVGVAAFLTLFSILVRKSFALALGLSLSGWLIIALGIKMLPPMSIGPAFLVSFLSTFLLYRLVSSFLGGQSVTGAKISLTVFQVISRAFLSGFFVALAVFLSKILNPVFGGIVAGLPVAMSVSLFIVHYRKGYVFSQALARSFLASGPFLLSVYAIFVYVFYSRYGLVWGTIFAYLATAIVSIPVYVFIKRKLR